MNIVASAKLRSFKNMIGFSIMGGLAFTLLQTCWPGASLSLNGASAPAAQVTVIKDTIDGEIAEAKTKVKAAEEALTKTKGEADAALKLPDDAANKTAMDNAAKALADAQKNLDDNKKTLDNAETAKKQNIEAEKKGAWWPALGHLLTNTGVVFALQLLAFLSQQKESAGIIRLVADQLGLKLIELPKDEPEVKALAGALPAAITDKMQEIAAPIRHEIAQAVAEKSRIEGDLAAMSQRMKLLRLGSAKIADERFCRVLLLGNGDAGKTEFIYHLMRYRGDHVDRPIPGNKSHDIRSYSVLHQASFHGTTQPPDVFQATAIELMDYRGQSPGKFLRALVERRYETDDCDFDMIILIVDLFQTPDTDGEPIKKQEKPQKSRVDTQQNDWGMRLPDFVDLSPRLKYVCLLINKCDMLDSMSTARKTAFAAYQDLAERIRTMEGVRNFERVACSLREGWMQHDIEGLSKQDGGIYPFLLSRIIANSTEVPKPPA